MLLTKFLNIHNLQTLSRCFKLSLISANLNNCKLGELHMREWASHELNTLQKEIPFKWQLIDNEYSEELYVAFSFHSSNMIVAMLEVLIHSSICRVGNKSL